MRLCDLTERISRGRLDEPFDYFPNEGHITGLVEFRERLAFAAEVPGFSEELIILQKSAIFETKVECMVPRVVWHKLNQATMILQTKAKGLRAYAGAMMAEQKPETISIRLPDCSDFSGVISSQQQIYDNLARLLFHPKIEGHLKVVGCETGSVWLLVFVGSLAAVRVIGSAVWAASVVRKKMAEAKIAEEAARSLGIRNELADELVRCGRAAIDNVIELEARALAAEHYAASSDHEHIQRLKLTIKEIADLVDRGAEIQPALVAPEEVTNLFPRSSKQLVESRVKQIQEHV